MTNIILRKNKLKRLGYLVMGKEEIRQDISNVFYECGLYFIRIVIVFSIYPAMYGEWENSKEGAWKRTAVAVLINY